MMSVTMALTASLQHCLRPIEGAAAMTKQASVPPRPSQELLDEELCRVVGGSLVMYGYDGKPVARYHLEDAWSAAKAT